MRVKFDRYSLAVEQKNYLTKILNASFVYDLDVLTRSLTHNLKLKNSLLAVTTIVTSRDEEKWVYSHYRIAFDDGGSWSFANDSVWNVMIFGVDNGS